MNKKKYFLIYLPCIFAFIIFVCFALVISNKTVQKNTYGQKINAKDTWKKVMADSANKSEISVSVTGNAPGQIHSDPECRPAAILPGRRNRPALNFQ